MAVPRLAESQDRSRAVTSDLDPRLRASSHSPCHPPVSRGHRASDRPNPLTREDSVFIDAGYANGGSPALPHVCIPRESLFVSHFSQLSLKILEVVLKSGVDLRPRQVIYAVTGVRAR